MNVFRVLALGGSICRFYEGLRVQEARFVVFYEVLSCWEAHLYVCYDRMRFSGGRMSNEAKRWGGSATERPSRVWRDGER